MKALIFDFDGVLVESEWVGNEQIARTLTALGYPTTTEQALEYFSGRGGRDFRAALERYLGGAIPAAFDEQRRAEDERVLTEGVPEVAGAVAFVHALPPTLPRAIASSSTTRWIRTHLDHLGLRDAFEPHIYSGREHVARGKPAPDIYLHAATQLDVAISGCVIIEDSLVGAEGAVASGATVIGLAAGQHCGPDHGERLRALGVQHVARSFDEIAALLQATG